MEQRSVRASDCVAIRTVPISQPSLAIQRVDLADFLHVIEPGKDSEQAIGRAVFLSMIQHNFRHVC